MARAAASRGVLEVVEEGGGVEEGDCGDAEAGH